MAGENQNIPDLKKIHLMPYAHCDYAWTNTREWHLWRYVEGFRETLDIMKEDGDFTFLVDNVAQTGKILSDYLGERMEEVKAYVRQGRICVVNGGVELIRPSQNGGELFIRNMVMGKALLREFYGVSDTPVFFNADTAVGHSQMPQILKLGGHKAYRFQRPNGALDYNRVPVAFIWRGLDGSGVTVSRGSYVGLSGEYMSKDRNVQIKGFFEDEVEPRLKIQPMEDLLIFVGGDDSLPMKTMFDVPIDLKGFIIDWNRQGKGRIEYSTLNKYFDEIARHELPVVSGTMDPCELSYCVTSKSIRSLWRRSYEYERLLLSAEKLIVMANKSGCGIDAGITESLWIDVAGISEHALDSLLADDYENKLLFAESIHFRLDQLIASAAGKIASKIRKQGEAQYIVFNTHPWAIEETFILHLSSPHHIKPFRLLDGEGKGIPFQIAEQYWGDKPYPAVCSEVDAAIRLAVKPFGWESVHLVFDESVSISLWNKRPLEVPEILDNGILRITEHKGIIIKVEDNKGRLLFGDNDTFCRPCFYPSMSTNDWYSLLEPIGKEEFCPESARMTAFGELINKVEVEGTLAGKPATITYTLKKGDRDIGVDFNYEGSDDEGTYALSFSCDEEPDIAAGIPFGVETRDVTKQAYGQKIATPKEPYLFAERSMQGLYWARHFTSFSKAGCRFAILQGNGNIFYRHDVPNKIVEVILTHSMNRSKKEIPWVKMMHESCFGQGRQAFSLSIVYAVDMTYADLHRLALQREQPFITTPRFNAAGGSLPLSGSFLEVKGMPVTALYQEKEDVIIRGFEANGETGSVKISGGGIKSSASCDLCLNVLERNEDPHNINILPWEIKTIKIEGFMDEQ